MGEETDDTRSTRQRLKMRHATPAIVLSLECADA
jgi:hypothetical protein